MKNKKCHLKKTLKAIPLYSNSSIYRYVSQDTTIQVRRSRIAKKVAKDKAQFDFKGFQKLQTKGKLKYGNLNELHVARVDTRNVGYTDLLNYVRSKQEDI